MVHDGHGTGWAVLDWFTGGDTPYMTLLHCMNGDTFWIAVTVILDLTVAAGYVWIALHWSRNERTLPDIPAKSALRSLRNIFLLCGICGYLFIPIKMVWPAWRLYDIFLLFLAYSTWKYAWGAKSLRVIYRELGRGSQLETDLEKSRDDAKRRDFFLNAISHDLRTPLNALVLQTSLAEMSTKANDREAALEAIRDVQASARWTAELLNTLLDFARLDWTSEVQNVDTFHLEGVIADVRKRVQQSADAKGLTVSTTCPADLTLRTDRTRVGRVLTSLFMNAVQFTKTGSVRVTVERSRGGIEIHVTDTGSGVSPEHQESLFDEFFQVHNVQRDRSKGYGMGLAIARRLARQLDGDVVVDSAVGSGSRFTFILPVSVVDNAYPGRVEISSDSQIAGAGR